MKKTNKIISIFLSLCIATAILPSEASAGERVTPSGIAYDRIGDEINKFASDKSYPSYRVCVFSDDEILYEGGDGFVDKDNGISPGENTVYEWGSVTKTITWISVMQLYEQGKIDLGADVRDYLPDDFVRRLRYSEPVTMTDLMNHTAGFEETVRNIASDDESNLPSLSEALIYCEPKQVFHPGEVTSYSNWGAALAGYVVECVSGETFTHYVHEHIFKPAGMEHTSIAPDYSDNLWVKERRGGVYSYTPLSTDGETVLIPKGKQLSYVTIYPAGSAAGTMSDLAKFGQALVSSNFPFFEKQETADFMFSASSFLGDTDLPKCCHGFCPTEGAASYLGHNGSTLGFTANLQFDRASKLGCAVFVNQYAETALSAGIPALLFGSADLSGYENAKAACPDLAGTYIQSRGHIKNSLRFLSYLSVIKIKPDGDNGFTADGDITLRPLDRRLVLMTAGEEGALAETSADGTRIYVGGSELIKTDSAALMHRLIFIYIGIAAAGFVMVMTFWIMRILRSRKRLRGAALLCAAHIAKVVSCLCLLAEIVASGYQMGAPLSIGVIAACVQTICVLLYALSAVSDVMLLIKEKSVRLVYGADAAANAFAAVIALLFGVCGL